MILSLKKYRNEANSKYPIIGKMSINPKNP
jgi:hypothetical protein